MKRALYLACAAALAISAAPLTACTPQLSGPVLGQTLVDDKALLAAEAGLYGANTAASLAVDAGALTPGSPKALAIADKLAQAKAALDVGRGAYKAGNSAIYLNQVQATQALLASAWTLIPAKEKPK